MIHYVRMKAAEHLSPISFKDTTRTYYESRPDLNLFSFLIIEVFVHTAADLPVPFKTASLSRADGEEVLPRGFARDIKFLFNQAKKSNTPVPGHPSFYRMLPAAHSGSGPDK